MSYTALLIVIPTICYSVAAILYFLKNNPALGTTYVGYALANLGLLAIDLKG
jgi:uncharacterized protein involved in cysteine biosynthesis